MAEKQNKTTLIEKNQTTKKLESSKIESKIETKKESLPAKEEKTFSFESSSSHRAHHSSSSSSLFSGWNIALIAIALIIIIFNQFQINNLTGASLFSFGSKSDTLTITGGKDLSKLDVSTLKSTGHTVAAVFPVENIKTQDDAMAIMFPSGTPDYGQALGVSFDDPVTSLATLANMYRGLQAEVQKNNPQAWQHFLNLATRPVGISCEYCCGVGPTGIDAKGNSLCGCQHNPALLSVALYLTAYTNYNDGEILREVMKWKTLFFPKNMIELGLTVAGGDTSKLNLPGMVGGC